MFLSLKFVYIPTPCWFSVCLFPVHHGDDTTWQQIESMYFLWFWWSVLFIWLSELTDRSLLSFSSLKSGGFDINRHDSRRYKHNRLDLTIDHTTDQIISLARIETHNWEKSITWHKATYTPSLVCVYIWYGQRLPLVEINESEKSCSDIRPQRKNL